MMNKTPKNLIVVTAFLIASSLLNLYLIINIWSRDVTLEPNPLGTHWVNEYNYKIIEIKCWVCLNGTYGFQPTSMVRIVPLDSQAIRDADYGWVGDAFKLDNRYGYIFTAPPSYYGKKWLFWQSEKTLMIIPNRTLTLEPGFESDSWWQNYG